MPHKYRMFSRANDLRTAVQEFDDIITALDHWHGDEQEAVLVDGDPGFGIGDIEIGIGPVDLARLAMHKLVPDEAFGVEIDLLLPCYQKATEQIDIGVADVLVRQRGGRPRRGGGHA